MESSGSQEKLTERVERDFYPRSWSRVGSLGFSLGLGGFSAFAASVLLGRGDLLGFAFAGIALWSGSTALRWFRSWKQGRPAISLTEDGILDGTAPGAPTFIPWSDIESVSDADGSSILRLRADARVRVPFHRRVLGWLTRRPKLEYVLPTRLLETHHSAVESFISEWHESLLLERVKDERARLTSGSES